MEILDGDHRRLVSRQMQQNLDEDAADLRLCWLVALSVRILRLCPQQKGNNVLILARQPGGFQKLGLQPPRIDVGAAHRFGDQRFKHGKRCRALMGRRMKPQEMATAGTIGQSLRQQPALPDPRLADKRNRAKRAVGVWKRVAQHTKFHLAACQSACAFCSPRCDGVARRRIGDEKGLRPDFPQGRNVLNPLDTWRRTTQFKCLRTDKNAVGRCPLLQRRGQVYRAADRVEAAAAIEIDLAQADQSGMDADAKPRRLIVRTDDAIVAARPGDDLHGRPASHVGVVLERIGLAKDADTAVAGEIEQMTVGAVDRSKDTLEDPVKEILCVIRIALRDVIGRTDRVDDQHRHEAAFGCRLGRGDRGLQRLCRQTVFPCPAF